MRKYCIFVRAITGSNGMSRQFAAITSNFVGNDIKNITFIQLYIIRLGVAFVLQESIALD